MTDHAVFADLEIRILEKQDTKVYPVETTLNGEQEFEHGLLQLESQPEPGCLLWIPTSSHAQDGACLFNWLLADEKLKTAWAQLRGQQPHRRVRLGVDATAPELHAIPWEPLCKPREGNTFQDLTTGCATRFLVTWAAVGCPAPPFPNIVSSERMPTTGHKKRVNDYDQQTQTTLVSF